LTQSGRGLHLCVNYSCIVDVLHPITHFAYRQLALIMTSKKHFEFLTDTNTCAAMLQEDEHYRRKQGTFSKDMVEKMTYESNTCSKALKF
jgi:hypothetical protein